MGGVRTKAKQQLTAVSLWGASYWWENWSWAHWLKKLWRFINKSQCILWLIFILCVCVWRVRGCVCVCAVNSRQIILNYLLCSATISLGCWRTNWSLLCFSLILYYFLSFQLWPLCPLFFTVRLWHCSGGEYGLIYCCQQLNILLDTLDT